MKIQRHTIFWKRVSRRLATLWMKKPPMEIQCDQMIWRKFCLSFEKICQKVAKPFLDITRQFWAVLGCLGPLFVARVLAKMILTARKSSLKNAPKVKVFFLNGPILVILGLWKKYLLHKNQRNFVISKSSLNFGHFASGHTGRNFLLKNIDSAKKLRKAGIDFVQHKKN